MLKVQVKTSFKPEWTGSVIGGQTGLTGTDPVTNRFDELVLFHGVDLLKFADVIERSLSESCVLYLQVLVVLQTDIVKMKLCIFGNTMWTLPWHWIKIQWLYVDIHTYGVGYIISVLCVYV